MLRDLRGLRVVSIRDSHQQKKRKEKKTYPEGDESIKNPTEFSAVITEGRLKPVLKT